MIKEHSLHLCRSNRKKYFSRKEKQILWRVQKQNETKQKKSYINMENTPYFEADYLGQHIVDLLINV